MPPGTGLDIPANESDPQVRLELLVRRASRPLMWFPTPDVFGVLLNRWHQKGARYIVARPDGPRQKPVQALVNASSTTLVRAGSILTPGPMVDETVMLMTYRPLALAGFTRRISSTTACTLRARSSRLKLTLPTRSWTLPILSLRYSTRPPLNSVTALVTSMVTVPVLGLGINPRGPSTRPSPPTLPMSSGEAIATSKSKKPPATRATRS